MPDFKTVMNYQYSTLDIIGKGFSSTVYKGYNKITGEEVAIKVISRQLYNELPFIQNEIKILTQLKGKHILKFYEEFRTQNNAYIITEYCRQGDLAAKIKQQGFLRQQEAINIIQQVVEGIYIMAQQNIIHRDLKPQNILLKDDGEGIRIADFGFAKSIYQLKNELNVGTPLYMSPETLIHSEYNSKSDIWSLGIMFYELLYGRTPWVVQTEQELSIRIVQEQIQFPAYPTVQEIVKDFIRSCLIVDPYLRIGIAEIMRHPLIKKNTKKIEFCEDNDETSLTIKSEIPNPSSPWHSIDNKKKLVFINSKSIKYTPNNNTEILHQLETQFNLCIFLNNVQSKLKDIKLRTPFLNEKSRIIIAKHMQTIKDKLHKQLFQIENVYGFKDWNSFYKTTLYQKFSGKFVPEYKQFTKICQEYNSLLKNNKQLILEYQKYDSEFYQITFGLEFKVIRNIIKHLIIELNHIIGTTQQSNTFYINLLGNLLYYLELIDHYFIKNISLGKQLKLSNLLYSKEIKNSDYKQLRTNVKRIMQK